MEPQLVRKMIFFGPLVGQVVPPVYAERLKIWDAWADVATGGDVSHS